MAVKPEKVGFCRMAEASFSETLQLQLLTYFFKKGGEKNRRMGKSAVTFSVGNSG